MVAFTQTQIDSRNNFVTNLEDVLNKKNYNKNYDTLLVESEMIKKKQDTIFLVYSITAVILVIATINIIKK
jgi:hypothetical protein